MSSNRILLRAGYDFVGKFLCKLDGTAEDLSTASLIEASLVNEVKTTELIADTAQTNANGADWATGVVSVVFAAAATTGLSPGNAWIEIAVVLAGKRLAYEHIPVVIEAGWAT